MPIFTASTRTSAKIASICSATNAGSTVWNDRTPCVFCAVSAVITAMP